MFASVIAPLTFLALASASPVPASDPGSAWELSKSNGFHLQAQLRPGSGDIDPPVSGGYLSSAHVGAGQNIAIVSGVKPADGSAYYVNGTEAQGWVDVLTDLGTTFPWGLNVQDADAFDPAYPGEHGASVNVGGGSDGIAIQRAENLVLLGGASEGSYAVCNRYIAYWQQDLQVVRYIYPGESVPEDCVALDFVPICAELAPLPEGSDATHEFAQEVDCVVSS
ncbi:uncharacterized protein F4812DRAFT_420446 [Daldinia caldariorum]|uniref:uncharacterized protein n=1 Tax=Daldinia caldariorum TaxID=326644 RepID=UPI002008E003|nr:uncharacterized protein F4812DRAFT_420446 [Daldinia caldariorum]KAI1469812.1 hypothetical protein F4812DRAFT_420446 [Daldinia caldariorum]